MPASVTPSTDAADNQPDALQAVRASLYSPTWWESTCSVSGYWVSHLMPARFAEFERQRLRHTRIGAVAVALFAAWALFVIKTAYEEIVILRRLSSTLSLVLALATLIFLVTFVKRLHGSMRRWGSLVYMLIFAIAGSYHILAYAECGAPNYVQTCLSMHWEVPKHVMIFCIIIPLLAPMVLHMSWQSSFIGTIIPVIVLVYLTASLSAAVPATTYAANYLFDVSLLVSWTIMAAIMWRQWEGYFHSVFVASAAATQATTALAAEQVERVRMEALREAHSKTISFASHELRNPLHAAMASFEAASEHSVLDAHANSSLKASVQQLGPQLAQMAGVLNDTVSMGAIVEDRLESSPGPVHIHGLVQDVVTQFAPYSAVPLHSSIAATVPASITADAHHLKQLLTSGVIMAVSATTQGAIDIHVSIIDAKAHLTRQLTATSVSAGSFGPELARGLSTALSPSLSPSSSNLSTTATTADASHFLEFKVVDSGDALQESSRGLDTNSSHKALVSTKSRHNLLHTSRGSGITLQVCDTLAGLLGGRVWQETLADGRVQFAFTVAMSEPDSSVVAATETREHPHMLPLIEPAGRRDKPSAHVQVDMHSRLHQRWQHAPRGGFVMVARHDSGSDDENDEDDGTDSTSTAGAGAGAGAGALAQDVDVGDDDDADEDAMQPLRQGLVLNTLLQPPRSRVRRRRRRPRAGAAGRPRPGHLLAPVPGDAELELPSLRVLWVDDVAMNRKIGQRMAAKLGHTCDILTDGDEALKVLLDPGEDTPTYDVVFLDIVMQRVNGDIAAKQLREAGCRIPLVAATGNAGARDWEYYMNECGFDAVLPKPFNAHAVSQVLARVVARSGGSIASKAAQ